MRVCCWCERTALTFLQVRSAVPSAAASFPPSSVHPSTSSQTIVHTHICQPPIIMQSTTRAEEESRPPIQPTNPSIADTRTLARDDDGGPGVHHAHTAVVGAQMLTGAIHLPNPQQKRTSHHTDSNISRREPSEHKWWSNNQTEINPPLTNINNRHLL